MKYSALFGWGIGIYATMFLVWSGFVTYGFIEGLLPRILGIGALIAVALIAGRSLRLGSWSDVLPYSLTWALIAVALDGIFSWPISGWAIYTDWNIWFGYALIAIAPLFAPATHSRFFAR